MSLSRVALLAGLALVSGQFSRNAQWGSANAAGWHNVPAVCQSFLNQDAARACTSDFCSCIGGTIEETTYPVCKEPQAGISCFDYGECSAKYQHCLEGRPDDIEALEDHDSVMTCKAWANTICVQQMHTRNCDFQHCVDSGAFSFAPSAFLLAVALFVIYRLQ
jgi:hypothetical protein